MEPIGDTNYDMLLKIKQMRNGIRKNGYDAVLNLLNDLMNLKGEYRYNALTEFKYVAESNLTQEKSRCFDRYKSIIKKELNIDINPKNDIITELRKILKSQGYRLRYYTKAKKYSIIKDC